MTEAETTLGKAGSVISMTLRLGPSPVQTPSPYLRSSPVLVWPRELNSSPRKPNSGLNNLSLVFAPVSGPFQSPGLVLLHPSPPRSMSGSPRHNSVLSFCLTLLTVQILSLTLAIPGPCPRPLPGLHKGTAHKLRPREVDPTPDQLPLVHTPGPVGFPWSQSYSHALGLKSSPLDLAPNLRPQLQSNWTWPLPPSLDFGNEKVEFRVYPYQDDFEGSKPLRAARGTKPLALGRGCTKCSPGVIDVEENVPLTMKCLHTKMVGDQRRKGDASLELTRGQIEKTLVLEGEDRTGGSYDKPSVLIDNGENAALTRKVRKKGETQASNSPVGKVNGVLSQKEKAEPGVAMENHRP
ncbi:hypothetical protein BKA82DRAFT_4020060 [Pisolithus tinctorius]|nr:hypothetical protein BKA82DRAFT_4020060 [Pisolithus tinctorius]